MYLVSITFQLSSPPAAASRLQLLAEEVELGVDELEDDLGPGLAEAGLHHLQHRQQAPRQLQLGPHLGQREVGEAQACTLALWSALVI